jgi:hypothetical protein
VLESIVELKNENGVKLNSLPNPIGQGNTGEKVGEKFPWYLLAAAQIVAWKG